MTNVAACHDRDEDMGFSSRAVIKAWVASAADTEIYQQFSALFEVDLAVPTIFLSFAYGWGNLPCRTLRNRSCAVLQTTRLLAASPKRAPLSFNR